MAYMTSVEIGAMTRSLMDEPDKKFVTDTELGAWLSAAQNEFRRLVYTIDPSNYEVSYSFTPAGVDYHSLDNVLMGTTPTQTRMEKLIRVCQVESTANHAKVRSILRACPNLESLNNQQAQNSYYLQGKVLRFSSVQSQPLRIDYVPIVSTNWATALTAATYIGDLEGLFGDLLALLAMQLYKVKDFSENPFQMTQLQKRTNDLRSYLNQGRVSDAGRYVTEEDNGW